MIIHPHNNRLCMLLALVISCMASRCVRGQLHLSKRIIPDVRLADVSSQGRSFTTPSGERIPAKDLVRWGNWPGLTRHQALWLSDGSWIAGELQTLDAAAGPQVVVEADWFEVPPIDMSLVRGMVINPPASLHEWIKLQKQMQTAEGRQDVIWLMNKQRVSGIIRWQTGSRRQLSGQELVLEGNNNQSVTIPWNDIQALVLSPTLMGPLPPLPPQSIGLVDGTLLNYSSIASSATLERDSARLEQRAHVIQLQSGIELPAITPADEWLAAIRYLAGRPEGVRFLSELKPASYRQASDNQLTWQLGEDLDCYGKPLIWRAKEPQASTQSTVGIVAKGLAMHGPAQVAYRLEPTSRRFLAQAVLAEPDPRTTLQFGNAVCRVLLARGGKLEEVLQFELSRNEAEHNASESTASAKSQQLIDVDVSGTQLLVLLVEKGQFGSLGDHVLWLDARLVDR